MGYHYVVCNRYVWHESRFTFGDDGDQYRLQSSRDDLRNNLVIDVSQSYQSIVCHCLWCCDLRY